MNQLKLVPELNYWMTKVLYNSPIQEKFFKVPIPVSEEIFKCRGSVLELLFNETYVEQELPSSSSDSFVSSSSSNRSLERKIPTYLYDPEVIILQRNSSSSDEQIEIPSSSTNLIPEEPSSSTTQCNNIWDCKNEIEGKFVYLYRAIYRRNISDWNVLQRTTPYIGGVEIYVADCLSTERLSDSPCGRYLPINLFGFTDEELCLMLRLYYYKTDQPVTILDIHFECLESNLSKCIYVYLNWELNESTEYYNDIKAITDGTNLLQSLYEKYVLDHIFRILNRRYYITLPKNNVDLFIGLNHDFRRIILTEEQVSDKLIKLPIGENPYYNRDVYLVHNATKQKYQEDFIIINDNSLNSFISWDHDRYQIRDELYYLWSFVDPKFL